MFAANRDMVFRVLWVALPMWGRITGKERREKGGQKQVLIKDGSHEPFSTVCASQDCLPQLAFLLPFWGLSFEGQCKPRIQAQSDGNVLNQEIFYRK